MWKPAEQFTGTRNNTDFREISACSKHHILRMWSLEIPYKMSETETQLPINFDRLLQTHFCFPRKWLHHMNWGAGMAQWWERSPSTNVSRVPFPDPASHVDWVCCWFSSLLREVFLRVLQFSPLLKNQHFQIPIRSGLLLSTLSWASGSDDRASTPCVWH